jgi:hypothetical protein
MQKVVLFLLCFSSLLSFSQQRSNPSQQMFYSLNNVGRSNPASQNVQMSNVSVARPANNLNKKNKNPQAQVQYISNINDDNSNLQQAELVNAVEEQVQVNQAAQDNNVGNQVQLAINLPKLSAPEFHFSHSSSSDSKQKVGLKRTLFVKSFNLKRKIRKLLPSKKIRNSNRTACFSWR